MKILKYLILLLLLVALGTAAYVALLDSSFEYEESIEAKAPRSLLFDQVDNLKNWENWLTREIGTAELSFPEKTKGENAHVEWKVKDHKISGKLTTVSVIQNSFIEQKAVAKGRIGKASYQLLWNFEEENDTTTVSLEVKGKHNFWGKARNLIQDDVNFINRLRTRTDLGLHRMRKKVLNEMKVYTVNIDGVKNAAPQSYLYISQASKNDPQSLWVIQQKALAVLHQSMSAQEVKPSSDPLMIYNTIDRENKNVIVSIGYPVEEENEYEDPENKILLGSLPAQKLVKGSLKGNYSNNGELWEAMVAYFKENELVLDDKSPIYEVLKITSEDSKNPADWLTELYFPIKEASAPE